MIEASASYDVEQSWIHVGHSQLLEKAKDT